MPIDAILFDMEGVLVDSEPYWYQSRQEFARDHGKEWTEADQRQAMGRATTSWAALMQERLAVSMTVDEIIADMKRRIIAHYEQHLPVRPGALEAVRLAATRYRVGLASGSPTVVIERVMELTGLNRIFEVIVYGDDIPHGKPAPDIYLAACARLGVDSKRALGIEDSANGIRSLKAAGMYTIAAPSPGFPLLPELVQMADRQIFSLEDFSLELVDEIVG